MWLDQQATKGVIILVRLMHPDYHEKLACCYIKGAEKNIAGSRSSEESLGDSCVPAWLITAANK